MIFLDSHPKNKEMHFNTMQNQNLCRNMSINVFMENVPRLF